MSQAWNEADGYHSGHVSRGAGNGLISCATRDTLVYWKHTTGDGTWSEPVIVTSLIGGDSEQFHTWYDGQYVWVTNGAKIWRSRGYGVQFSWVSY